VIGDYLYTDGGCTTPYVGNGNWYHVFQVHDWAIQINSNGYVAGVWDCTVSPTPSVTPSISPSITPSISTTPSITPTATPSITPTIATLPTFTFSSDDITLSNTSCTYQIGSNQMTLTWTPSGMATSPHINYIWITRPGPVNVYTGSRANCRNGVPNNTIPITLNENVDYSINYLVTIDYSNV
jgi:hypothetical protein